MNMQKTAILAPALDKYLTWREHIDKEVEWLLNLYNPEEDIINKRGDDERKAKGVGKRIQIKK